MRSDKPRLQNLIKKQNQLLKVKEIFLRCETFIATQMQEWQNKKRQENLQNIIRSLSKIQEYYTRHGKKNVIWKK